MALKDDIESIKNDLIGESRFLEEYIKLENHFKKHKKKIFSVVIALVVIFSASFILNAIEESKQHTANEAYLEYAKDPSQIKNIETIKESNPALYTLITLKEAVKSGDKKTLEDLSTNNIAIIAELAKYHIALLSDDTKKIEEYAINEKAALRDFAFLQLAYKQYKNGDIKEAKQTLARVPYESSLKKSATYLEHYGLTE